MLYSMPALTELESIPIDLVASILHGRLDFALAVPTDAQTSAYVILLTCGSKLQRALQHLDTSPPSSVLWEPYPQVRYCSSALPEPQLHTVATELQDSAYHGLWHRLQGHPGSQNLVRREGEVVAVCSIATKLAGVMMQKPASKGVAGREGARVPPSTELALLFKWQLKR